MTEKDKIKLSELKVNYNEYKKLYDIKRLFYLPLSTKVQFFKTFILPLFHYC